MERPGVAPVSCKAVKSTYCFLQLNRGVEYFLPSDKLCEMTKLKNNSYKAVQLKFYQV